LGVYFGWTPELQGSWRTGLGAIHVYFIGISCSCTWSTRFIRDILALLFSFRFIKLRQVNSLPVNLVPDNFDMIECQFSISLTGFTETHQP
jgi:hypothetical protein